MKCTQVKESLYLFAGGDLSRRKTKKISNHLQVCESCNTELDQIKQSMGILVDSLKTEQGEINPDVLWQKVQDGIETISITEESGIQEKIGKWFESIPNKLTWLPSPKTSLGLAASLVIIFLSIIVLTQNNPEMIRTNNIDKKEVSALDKYPVVEAYENKNVTVMTLQTDDPNIKVVWFFDENFRL